MAKPLVFSGRYPSLAAMVLRDKMAGNTTTVRRLLGGLRDALVLEGRRVVEASGELKRSDLESRGEQWDGHVYWWDSSFYTQKISIKNRENSVDKTEDFRFFFSAAYGRCDVGDYGQPFLASL